MTQSNLLHRFSCVAVGVALVTLIFGALVTTNRAGMAFLDWPTSDGWFMLTYPWLADLFARNWDKFLEHGHRLAGAAIGMWSILLTWVAWRRESRIWVRWLTVGVLLGVICQGLLGGFRVRLDERLLAMLHGIFAAVVFSLLGILMVVTSRPWRDVAIREEVPAIAGCKMVAISLTGITFIQYVLGSLVRHQGLALHEHLGLGLLVLMLAIANSIVGTATGNPWLRNSAVVVLLIVLGQVGLGLAAWAFKYGIPSWGYVAVADSIRQVTFRTAHMVMGTVTMLACVAHLVKVLRVDSVAPKPADALAGGLR